MNDKLGNCIAFYDVNPVSFNTQGWYRFVLEWFEKHHQIPTRMALDGKYVKPSTQTKIFKHYDKVIKEIKFQGVTDIWIGSTPKDAHFDQPDAIFGASFNFDKKGKDSVLTFDNAVIPFLFLPIEILIFQATQYFTSTYAIAFQRHFDKGPLYYAHGAILNEEYPGEDSRAISRWLHRYGDPKRYQVGDLRDIYPMNFISRAHLKRVVKDKTLQEWIQSSPQHGTLKPLTDILWSWVVPEENIAAVRDALKEANLLVVYRE